MTDTAESFDLESFVRCQARDAVNSLDDFDADIRPTVFLVSPRGVASVHVEVPQDQAGKDNTALEIAASMAVTQAVKAAFLCMAWMTKVAKGENPDDLIGHVAERADRQEVVMLTLLDEHGLRSLIAPVERAENMPPSVGQWIHEKAVDGRFANALRMGRELSENAASVPGLSDILDDAWDQGGEGIGALAQTLMTVMKKQQPPQASFQRGDEDGQRKEADGMR